MLPYKKLIIYFLLFNFSNDLFADFSCGSWIQYWKIPDGTNAYLKNIDCFTEASPFHYDMDENGNLIDNFKSKKIIRWIRK